MTLIRVNPASVRGYGTQAQSEFEAISNALSRLTNDVVGVRYFGPNAVSFKTECGRLAVDFGRRIHTSMAQMSEAVRRSTSNIAASLGGQPIVIQLDDRPITAPSPTVVDYVDVDTAALEATMPVVASHFTAIRSHLDRNASALRATDWLGNAKESAVGAVTQLSAAARLNCDEAEQVLTSFIQRQVDAVLVADV